MFTSRLAFVSAVFALGISVYFNLFDLQSEYFSRIKYKLISLFSSDTINERILTKKELSKHDNEENGIYLAILGKIFDVTSGVHHYGSGKSYHFFTGKDASRAFITGDFTEGGLTDDVLDLPLKDLKSLTDWIDMYNEKYIYIGKLAGRYYDEYGRDTSYNEMLKSKLSQFAVEEANEKLINTKYPPCNSQYKRDEGTTVWCSKKSGGIARDWAGVPRKLYLPGAKSYRCACVNIQEYSDPESSTGLLKQYENCAHDSPECAIPA